MPATGQTAGTGSSVLSEGGSQWLVDEPDSTVADLGGCMLFDLSKSGGTVSLL